MSSAAGLGRGPIVMEHGAMRMASAALTIATILALTSCGDGDDRSDVPQVASSQADASVADSPSESPTTEPAGPTGEELRLFVELLTTNQPDDAMQAFKMTAKVSAARAVVTVWHARYMASQMAGNDSSGAARSPETTAPSRCA